VDLCHLGLGLGAGRALRVIFFGGVAILGGGADRGACQCRGCQRDPLGYLVGVGCYLVAFPKVRD
jgi:hypothetical protein